jgi:hypothetical protein
VDSSVGGTQHPLIIAGNEGFNGKINGAFTKLPATKGRYKQHTHTHTQTYIYICTQMGMSPDIRILFGSVYKLIDEEKNHR